jgi:polyferredoxin
LNIKIAEFKTYLKDHSTSIIRHIVQIIAFLIINYIIIELIFLVNLLSFEGLVKMLPILNSPRNKLSNGAGIVEYIFFSLAEGVFPFLLLGIFILIILFTNRFFCGWICPIGTIQDACSAIPTNKRKVKIDTNKSLLKIKYVVVIFLFILLIPLAISRLFNEAFYIQFKSNLGDFAEKPMAYFSLSEYIFVFFPNMIKDIFTSGSLEPLFLNLLVLVIFFFYLIIIILSVWYPRIYCRYLCPFAALAATVSEYSFLKLSRSPAKCIGRSDCGICEKNCPKQIRILDEPFEFFTGKGECNLCLKCQEVCPYKAITIKFG